MFLHAAAHFDEIDDLGSYETYFIRLL